LGANEDGAQIILVYIEHRPQRATTSYAANNVACQQSGKEIHASQFRSLHMPQLVSMDIYLKQHNAFTAKRVHHRGCQDKPFANPTPARPWPPASRFPPSAAGSTPNQKQSPNRPKAKA